MSALKEYINDSTHKCNTREVDDGYKIVTGYVIPYNCIPHQEINVKEAS